MVEYVAPDAAHSGPISVLCDGDHIQIDLSSKRIALIAVFPEVATQEA